MLSNLCLVLHDKALQLASMGRGHGGAWDDANRDRAVESSDFTSGGESSPVGYSPITQSDELYGAVEHVKSGWVMHECKGLWPIWSIYG
ncbi:hypothetical protein V1477_012034 [Vespula maculifrons]|uniref:Uncharacterized protein n=2 Tax=Vespula TaxID=7451 RepID=A0A834JEJ8_VESVU|nr:hypothetical protein HZH66_011027 [Vespula vulgaris]